METVARELRDPQIILFSAFKLTDEEIGEKFGISADTVRHDRERIYTQIEHSNLAYALVMYMVQKKITMHDIMCVFITRNQLNT